MGSSGSERCWGGSWCSEALANNANLLLQCNNSWQSPNSYNPKSVLNFENSEFLVLHSCLQTEKKLSNCVWKASATSNRNFTTCVLFLCLKKFKCIALPVYQADLSNCASNNLIMLGLFWFTNCKNVMQELKVFFFNWTWGIIYAEFLQDQLSITLKLI